jgi:uncharacterized membrane protein YphA (DoxX/SURF4 family)
MRTGRITFGVFAVVLAVVFFIWHDSELWSHLPPIGVKAQTALAWVVTIATILGGLGIMIPRTARVGASLVGIVFVLYALACIPGIVAAPTTYGSYVDFFELLAIVSGAIAVIALATAENSRAVVLGRTARILLGVCTISFALTQIDYLKETASQVPPWLPPSPMFWAVLTTIAFGLAALAILIDRSARLALRLMSIMIDLFGLAVWVPRVIAQPHMLFFWSEGSWTFLIATAAWLVAEVCAS